MSYSIFVLAMFFVGFSLGSLYSLSQKSHKSPETEERCIFQLRELVIVENDLGMQYVEYGDSIIDVEEDSIGEYDKNQIFYTRDYEQSMLKNITSYTCTPLKRK